jgi:hypothetical protein
MRSDTALTGKITDHDRRSNLHFLGAAKPASLRAHHQQYATIPEWPLSVQADHADRDVHPQPGTSSNSFGRYNFHTLQAPNCTFVNCYRYKSERDDDKGNGPAYFRF